MENVWRSIERILRKAGCNSEAAPNSEEKWKEVLKAFATLLKEERARKEVYENTLVVSTNEMEHLLLQLQKKSALLADSELYFRTMFLSSPYPIVYFMDDKIYDCNPAFLTALKRNRNDVIGKTQLDFSPDAQPDGQLSKDKSQFIEERAKKDGSFRCEWLFQTAEGADLPVEQTLVVIDLNGKQTTMAIWRDLTHERKIQEKLVQSAKLSSLGEMSAGVAHEINNPLAIIVGNIPLIIRARDNNERFLQKIESVSKAAFRIERIVKGLMKYSRSSGQGEYKLECLSDIINEARILTEAKSKRKFTPLEIQVQTDAYISCDSVEIEQVLVNLINNAVDAVAEQADRWVKIHAFDEGNEAIVRVMDSGNGISPQLEQKIFQPFFTTKSVGEGTGLGLSISKGIMDQHKASLFINRSFQNTCFELRFLKRESDGLKHAA